MPKTHTADGKPTRYALALGYIDRDTRDAESGPVQFDLSFNGSSYDVNIIPENRTREYVTLPNGHRVLEGWAQFDTLREARAFKAQAMRYETVGMAWAACIAAMS